MSRALGDIVDYYNAGTILGALESIVSEAGKKEQTAASDIEKKIQRKIEMQYKTGPLRKRIKDWLLKNPRKNVPAFKTWLQAKTPLVALSPIFWVNSKGTTETELLDAIMHFKIPK